MWPVLDPGPLALESDALPIALRGSAHDEEKKYECLTVRIDVIINCGAVRDGNRHNKGPNTHST